MLMEKLEKLAKIKAPSARSELVRMLSAQYSDKQESEPSEAERQLFSALVLDVFDQLDRSARLDIVVRLAKTDRITSPLADRLAGEAFELCEPVLEHSPVISGARLADIARQRSDRHRLAIARRSHVPAEIVDTLIARGAFPVVNALLHNPGAVFEVRALLATLILAASEARLMGAMAGRCTHDEVFCDDLRLIGQSNCPLMPVALSQALDNDDALFRLAETAVADDRDPHFDVDGESLSRHEVRIQIAAGELSFETILLILIDRQDMAGIIWLLAHHLNMREGAIRDTFASQADGTVALLMKETGIGHKTYGKFARLRHDWLGLSGSGVADEVYRFRTMRQAASPRRVN
ncbi:DUF2336 domain-containing protein [Stappia taiwanensis]|uniref:DUF2336 domain-containing protein n=1 Tax=Stappia taiwanensis TaxID=992267 RepID=A0A838XU70_9HYPH|nr:DUF2336 domain-containing protein [Stappia taiwanensis]MBA4610410.1 DUF2336 domain-containing protein [Stappia taiwanensis]GGE85214.1 hypothetical protein GCM10007285_10960 [Stappia taiwanensis]